MRIDRDWVDYANLASNVAQNVQLSGIQERLSGIQELAGAQAQEALWARLKVEKAAEKAERLAKFREAVVQGERYLEGLNHHLSTNPRAVLALALGFKDTYERNGLSTSIFETFDEKDRVGRLLRGLDDVIEQGSSQLTQEQRGAARKCLQYRLDDEDLQFLIKVQKHREQQAHEQRELATKARPDVERMRGQLTSLEQALRAEQQKRDDKSVEAKQGLADLFGGLIGLGVVAIVGLLISAFVAADSANPGLTSMLIWICMAMVFTGCFALFRSLLKASLEEPERLRKEIEYLRKQLVPQEALLVARPPDEGEKALYARFGGGIDTPSAEYETMLAQRRAFVAKVLPDTHPYVASNGPAQVANPCRVDDSAPTEDAQRSPVRTTSGTERGTPSGGQQVEAIPNGKTVVFGPLQPGIPYPSMEAAVQAIVGRGRQGMDKETVDYNIDWMLSKGYSFILQKNPYDIAVYSKTPQVKTIAGALDYAEKVFHISSDANVMWHRSARTVPRPVRLTDVFCEPRS